MYVWIFSRHLIMTISKALGVKHEISVEKKRKIKRGYDWKLKATILNITDVYIWSKKKKQQLQNTVVVSLSLPHIWSGWLSSRQELSLIQEHQPKQHRGPKPDLFALCHLIWLSLSPFFFFYNHLSSFGKQTKKKKQHKCCNPFCPAILSALQS